LEAPQDVLLRFPQVLSEKGNQEVQFLAEAFACGALLLWLEAVVVARVWDFLVSVLVLFEQIVDFLLEEPG